MASRKDQKAQAREQRLAKEREASEAAQRRQRLQIVGGIAAIAVVVVVVIFVIAGSGGSKGPSSDPASKTNQKAAKQVNDMLDGIPQGAGQDITLGNPKAKVTITEFGDLECSVCDELDTPSGWRSPDADTEGYAGSGVLDQVITNLVKTGKAKLVYRSLETATGSGGSPKMWTTQQAAANAAALQGKGWNYVELFYNEQGYEKADYVTDAYLEGIAKQVKGLNYGQWFKDWKNNKAVTSKVAADNNAGIQLDSTNTATGDQVATPTLWIQGPKSQHIFVGGTSYSSIASIVNANS
jgi:protein-disulfide isomerase